MDGQDMASSAEPKFCAESSWLCECRRAGVVREGCEHAPQLAPSTDQCEAMDWAPSREPIPEPVATVTIKPATSAEPVGYIPQRALDFLRLASDRGYFRCDIRKTPEDDSEVAIYTATPHALAAAQAEVKRLREALIEARRALEVANETDGGGINDTIWMPGRPETLFDFMDAALSTTADTSELDRLVADAGRAKWQPIETAPKDGTDVLVFNAVSGEQFVAYFKRGKWFFSAHSMLQDDPTFWMPLPDEPDAARAEVKS